MVKPKKHLGQHFLEDEQIAQRIVEALQVPTNCKVVIEIGAGTGVLTQYLVQKTDFQLYVAEIDTESVAYLHKKYAHLKSYIQEVDFLTLDLNTWILPDASPELAIISNFPYNISSQIFFKILDHKDRVTEVVGMLQKEVAERLASPAGTRDYGILSVFLQAYYEVEYLFAVEPEVFNPPPKVRSGVIRLRRNQVSRLPCDEMQFRNVVKTGFNQRRKTLRNALKPLLGGKDASKISFLDLRAEQLSVDDFVKLTLEIYAV
jgi:16S rRNA (adenine1518-N6/adenine1519-N6)-dimethyltransferase